MIKQKTIWCCSNCGQTESKWSGQCLQCNQWNTFHEETDYGAEEKRFVSKLSIPSEPVRIEEVELDSMPRILTGIAEFDRLLGGGVVRGSMILVGGDPGIGKSTLLLQASHAIALQGLVVLYVCGEESVVQTSMRAKRLGISGDNLLLHSETNFSLIKRQVDRLSPDVLIIDSIQIIYKSELSAAPGSVSQVRETATELMHLAKGQGISIFLIGHVTKSGDIAGPRVLEHLVDTVLYFEERQHQDLRMMRVVKNRFGSTDELGVFQMGASGLVEVENPSQIFLEERMKGSSGSVILPTIEGSRTILVEVQALVTDTSYSTPSRRSTGLDSNRLALLLAVLEKRVGYQLSNRDVFVSIVGGLKITEPAIDLGIILAIASSLTNRKVNPDTVVMGEVGLGGELRSIPRIKERLKEAIRMGFRRALIPKRNLEMEVDQKIELIGMEQVEEAIRVIIG